MKLYLVRHAQSQRNIMMKDAPVDAELTEVGKEQARRIGYYFGDVKITKVYVSTMKRARTTFNEIKNHLKGIPIEFREDLVEHKMGVHEEKNENWLKYAEMAKSEGKSFEEYRPAKGESLMDVYQRAGRFYKYLMENHSDDSILVVGHGTFLNYLILNILGFPIQEGKYFGLSNAGVSQFEIGKSGKIKNFHINDYHHLIIGEIKEDIEVIGKVYGKFNGEE